MCGRYTLVTDIKLLAEHFGFAADEMSAEAESLKPRYNLAPSQEAVPGRRSFAEPGRLRYILKRKAGYIKTTRAVSGGLRQTASMCGTKRSRGFSPGIRRLKPALRAATLTRQTATPRRIRL